MSSNNDINVKLGADVGDLGKGFDKAAGVVRDKTGQINAIMKRQAEEAAAIARKQAAEIEEQARKQAAAIERTAKESADRMTDIGRGLQSRIAGMFSLGAIVGFVNSTKQAVTEAEASYRGLEAVANYAGVGVGAAMKAAGDLAADGLMSTAEASKALQNLLSRGYSLDQAMSTLSRLKDAAAFNRQANLEMGEAVLNATEGLKNENSILVDNAGVTKNVAKMWEEYAKQHGLVAANLTTAQKIQAEYNGVMAETEAQVGNAAKASEGLQGQSARLNTTFNNLKVTIGEALTPAFQQLAEWGTWIINNVFTPMLQGVKIIGAAFAAVAVDIGNMWNAVTSWDFSKLGGQMRANAAMFKETVDDILAAGPGSSFKPTADNGRRKAPAADAPPDKKAQDKAAKAAERTQARADRQNNNFDRAMFDENMRVEREFFAKKGELITRQRALDMQAAQSRKNATLDAIAAEEQAEQHRYEMGAVTYEQMLASQQEFLSQKQQAEQAYLDAKLAQIDPSLDPVGYAQIKEEMLEVERRYQLDRQQITDEGVQQQFDPMRAAYQSLEQNMAGTLQRLFTLQTSLAGALKSLWQGVTNAIAGEFAKMAAKIIMEKIKMMIFGKTAAMSEIATASGKAGANGVASWAAAPWPINIGAPAFGASMAAAAMAFAPVASAAGGFDIPAGLNPVTQLHAREMVLPAKQADVIRRMADGDGGGSATGGQPIVINQTNNISALDGHSVRRVLEDNAGAVVAAIKSAHRDFNT
jgi:hypothetical protein